MLNWFAVVIGFPRGSTRLKKPYEDRTDLEKCQSQWRKLQGLHSRAEWSMAIVRTATAAEIAVNYAIRAEFNQQSELPKEFVDSTLMWANGLRGKIDHLLVRLTEKTDRSEAITKLTKVADQINNHRNAIVHRGEFRDENEAKETIEKTRRFIESLVRLYDPSFTLHDRNKWKKKKRKRRKKKQSLS
jgi:hypothetical protein